MDNLNDLKMIWLTADTRSLPGSNDIVIMAKKYRIEKLVKKLGLITAGVVLTGIEVLVVFIYKSTLFTTRIGEACIIIAGAVLVATNTNSIGRFYRFNDFSNKEFLEFLEQTRLNQVYYYKKTQVAALIFCSAGLLCYPFETIYKYTVWAIVAYCFIIIYLLVLWLVVRPRAFRKQTRKLNETINRLEKLSKQLN